MSEEATSRASSKSIMSDHFAIRISLRTPKRSEEPAKPHGRFVQSKSALVCIGAFRKAELAQIVSRSGLGRCAQFLAKSAAASRPHRPSGYRTGTPASQLPRPPCHVLALRCGSTFLRPPELRAGQFEYGAIADTRENMPFPGQLTLGSLGVSLAPHLSREHPSIPRATDWTGVANINDGLRAFPVLWLPEEIIDPSCQKFACSSLLGQTWQVNFRETPKEERRREKTTFPFPSHDGVSATMVFETDLGITSRLHPAASGSLQGLFPSVAAALAALAVLGHWGHLQTSVKDGAFPHLCPLWFRTVSL